MTETPNIEDLLRRAFEPVDPPKQLSDRLHTTLTGIAALAADELEALEPDALRDPRNWVRPTVAIVVGSAAGVVLLALELRRRSRQTAKTRGLFGPSLG